MCAQAPKQCIHAAQAFEGLQALRVDKTRELKWLERKGFDIQVSFLFEIQDSRGCELRSLTIDVCIVSLLSAVFSGCIGTYICFTTGRG
jgi:hypothetical protein